MSLKCTKHPKYQGKMMPRADCLSCWKYYKTQQKLEHEYRMDRTDRNIKRLECKENNDKV